MSEESVLVDRHKGVAVVTINRPHVHNALDRETLRSLAAIHAELECDPWTRAIVLTGAGDRAFSAGADLDELAGLDAATAYVLLEEGQRVMAQVERTAVPIVAAVNGLALGGGFELVLASTFAVMSTQASLALPESGLGLIPGYGGTQRLPRVIGAPAAAHVMLTGTRISARRAYELGLTPLEPVAPDELRDVAVGQATTIAARGPRAHTAILRALQTSLPTADELALESALAAVATGSQEAAEGIAAFRDRRPAVFNPTEPEEN